MTSSKQGARTPKGAEPAPPDRPPAAAGRRPPKLLFVSAGLGAEGGGIAAAGRLLLDAVRGWAADRGVAVRLLSLGERGDVPAGLDGAAFAGDQARLAAAVWRAQVFEGYRVHVYDFLGVARVQGVLPARVRARYLLYLYGIECWRPLRGSRHRALESAVVRLACSSHTIDRMREWNPGAPPVTPLALALRGEARPAPAAPSPADPLPDGFLLIVGRMATGERYKGHDELIGATRRLAAAGSAAHLVVAGDGDDRGRLEALARELGVAERVHFTGFVGEPQLADLYRRCAALVMPSRGEGFGLVYLEAMRAGKPCVALRDSAAAEIVVDGETGVLVDPGVEPLVAALGALLSDPQRATALGAAGRRRFERDFQAEAFAARLRPHLDRLLAAEAAAAEPRRSSQARASGAR